MHLFFKSYIREKRKFTTSIEYKKYIHLYAILREKLYILIIEVLLLLMAPLFYVEKRNKIFNISADITIMYLKKEMIITILSSLWLLLWIC